MNLANYAQYDTFLGAELSTLLTSGYIHRRVREAEDPLLELGSYVDRLYEAFLRLDEDSQATPLGVFVDSAREMIDNLLQARDSGTPDAAADAITLCLVEKTREVIEYLVRARGAKFSRAQTDALALCLNDILAYLIDHT